MVDGRAFLDSARHLLSAPSEANRRSAAGQLYLALLHEAWAALDRWGFPLPPGNDVDAFVVSHFGILTHFELLRIAGALTRLQRSAKRPTTLSHNREILPTTGWCPTC
jgi:hypothetical protein